jgi:hypothetical protein
MMPANGSISRLRWTYQAKTLKAVFIHAPGFQCRALPRYSLKCTLRQKKSKRNFSQLSQQLRHMTDRMRRNRQP